MTTCRWARKNICWDKHNKDTIFGWFYSAVRSFSLSFPLVSSSRKLWAPAFPSFSFLSHCLCTFNRLPYKWTRKQNYRERKKIELTGECKLSGKYFVYNFISLFTFLNDVDIVWWEIKRKQGTRNFFRPRANKLFFNEIATIQQRQMNSLAEEERELKRHKHTYFLYPDRFRWKRGKTFYMQQHQHRREEKKLSKQGVLP